MKFAAAVEAYQKAADCFKADDATTSANQVLVKVADLCAMEQVCVWVAFVHLRRLFCWHVRLDVNVLVVDGRLSHLARRTVQDYKRAVQLYEEVATKSLDNQLTKWSCTEYCSRPRCAISLLVPSRRATM